AGRSAPERRLVRSATASHAAAGKTLHLVELSRPGLGYFGSRPQVGPHLVVSQPDTDPAPHRDSAGSAGVGAAFRPCARDRAFCIELGRSLNGPGAGGECSLQPARIPASEQAEVARLTVPA